MLARPPGAKLPPIRVLQIGDGVFLRGFADWLIDVANEKVDAGIGVAVACARPHAKPPTLAAQDGRYTVLERGLIDGKAIERARVVDCVQLVLDPHAEPQRLREIAASPELRFVISNTTEAGIVEAEEPYDSQTCPLNFPAKTAWLLKARFDSLGGGAAGLVFLPCELIEHNGRELRRLTLAAAERWGFDEAFTSWIKDRCRFHDTLVDRIVPGFPTAEAERMFADWGYRDPLAIVAEPFHLWAIEGEVDPAWPLADAGLNVVWTRDIRPYRDAKLRMLNGAHTALAPPAFLAGLETVRDAVRDPLFARYLERLMFDEIAPYAPLPADARVAYARGVLERFANPFLRHELLAITLNSVAKWRARLLPTLRDANAATGDAPPLLAFAFAAFVRFHRGEAARGAFSVREEPAALAAMREAWNSGDAVAATRRALSSERLWGEDLSALPGFAAKAIAAATDIQALGVRGALDLRIG